MNLTSYFAPITGAEGKRRGGRTLCTAATEGQGQSQSLLYRNRYLVSGLLLVNVALGGYILLGNKKTTQVDEVEEKLPDVEDKASVNETKVETVPSASVVAPPPQISAEEQRDLLKWVLEEKRKIKPADPAEKKRLDEEKALLKKYIRSKEIPTL